MARAPPGKAPGHRTAKPSKSLRELYEDQCREHAAHPNTAFAKILPDKQGMPLTAEVLDLSNNYVGDKGIVAVAGVIQRCTHLKRIVVAKNGLRNAGIRALCSALAKHPSVTALDVSENYISHGAAEALTALLTENPRIVQLDFADTKLDVEERLRLKELAAQNAVGRVN